MNTLSEKEMDLLYACVEYSKGEYAASIDFDKVAAKVGYKDAANARTMFMRLKRSKMSGGHTPAASSSNAATADGSPAEGTNKRKASSGMTKPAAKRGRKNKAAKATAVKQDDSVDDEEGALEEAGKDEVALSGEKQGGESGEEA
ncbi:MAG: hypothetical protein FRX48_06386 [Lasallia pustulata]|uniref:Myb-like DNA-binding domain-containing protein n=1 Tax=Lasallia pustulata TaxID=136370 RepID=A0A5M8PMQ7_9LECA|nr:MAG: hypothetical protein FRX48_06386 [Lasallia pustulata]